MTCLSLQSLPQPRFKPRVCPVSQPRALCHSTCQPQHPLPPNCTSVPPGSCELRSKSRVSCGSPGTWYAFFANVCLCMKGSFPHPDQGMPAVLLQAQRISSPSTPWCSPCLSGQIGCQHVSQTEGLNEAITGPGNINVSTCTESTDKRTGRTTCAS